MKRYKLGTGVALIFMLLLMGCGKSDVQQEGDIKETVETIPTEESMVLLEETKTGDSLEEENEYVITKPVVIEKNTFHEGILMETRTFDEKGNVLSLDKRDFPEEEIYRRWEQQYDGNGNLLAVLSYGPDGIVYEKEVYTYDEAGNKLTFDRYQDESLEKVYSEVFTYDEKGNCLNYEYNDFRWMMSGSSESQFDEAGNEVSTYYYEGDGSLSSWIECTYDKEGNKLSQIDYNADGSVDQRIENIYDGKGNLLTQTYYKGDQKMSLTEYVYDARGNMLSAIYTNLLDGVTSREESTFDENGNELTYTYFDETGHMESKIAYFYDEKGNTLSQITYDSNGEIETKTEYVYDEYDNVVIANIYSARNGEMSVYEYTYEMLFPES